MRNRTIPLTAALLAASLLAASPSALAQSNPLMLTRFNDATGLEAGDAAIQRTWNALVALGTDEFVGGAIGNFKIDEASLIAGAMAIGATELDNFLRSGSLSMSSSGLGRALTSAMSGAAGIDMSALTGSYTAGGGDLSGIFTTPTAVRSAAGGASAAGQCDAAISSKQVAVGLLGVRSVVDAAMSDQYGFSQNAALSGGGSDSGFAARGCLDKLFQNAGSDILFKPPSLGNLTSMLSGWSCDQAVGVAEQVAGQFGDMSQFNTAGMGGFFPWGVYGEANDGAVPVRPGIGNKLSEVFGSTFDETNGSVDARLTSLDTMFN